LRLSALAPDGVVEGLEASGEPFLMGVQFHPEYTEETPELASIFDILVSRARHV
jgi:putative glutamine amidotransferase